MSRRYWLPFLGWLVLGCLPARSQSAQRITLEVVDENGVAVADARVSLNSANGSGPFQCRTSPAGMCTLVVLNDATYSVWIEKESFYVTEAGDLHLSPSVVAQFTLARQR